MASRFFWKSDFFFLSSLVQVINHLFLSPLQSVCCHSCLVSSSSNEHGVFRIAFFLRLLPLTSSVIYVGDRCSHKYTYTPGTCRTSHKSASRSDHSKPPSTVYWTTKSVNAWVKQLWISAVKDDRDHMGFYVDLIWIRFFVFLNCYGLKIQTLHSLRIIFKNCKF